MIIMIIDIIYATPTEHFTRADFVTNRAAKESVDKRKERSQINAATLHLWRP